MIKVLEEITKDGWKPTDTKFGTVYIYEKGQLRLHFDGKRVVWMYDLSRKNYQYKGVIPDRYRGIQNVYI